MIIIMKTKLMTRHKQLWASMQIDDYDKHYSEYDSTMIGFIHDKGAPSTMTDHNIECFYAVFKEFKTKDSAEPVFATKLAHEAADEAK